MFMKKIALAATTALVGTMFASAAFAQATGSTTVQELVVTKKKIDSVGGVVTQQEAPKTRSIVTQEYISTQGAGATALSDLNIVPGVVYQNDDVYGITSSGSLSIHGIRGQFVAELVDGVPLNDGGNYAIYSGELVDPEIIASINVVTGSTDVDAPSSSSLGGQINIQTLVPTKNFGGFVNISGGSWDFGRVAFLVNTGEFGPLGTRMWIEGSDQWAHAEYGPGAKLKKQANAKIYQDLHHEGDFIAVTGFYDDQIQPFFAGDDFASFTTSGVNKNPASPYGNNLGGLLSTPWNYTYSTNLATFQTPFPAQPKIGTSTNSVQYPAYYGAEFNPTKTGHLAGESRFTLLPGLKLTFDPSYQWVLANGEGETKISPTDPRLVGVGLTSSKSNLPACYTAGVVTGISVDGSGSCANSAYMLSPSNTQTNRFTINSSLIWNFMQGQVLQLSYAWDHANIRQTGEYGLLNAAGFPNNVFGGLQGYGTPILAADGSIFEKRNRHTVAELSQISAEYVGKFFDDHLRVDLGVRDPHFTRDLSQYCYTSSTNGSSVYCTTNASIASANGYGINPFNINIKYDKALPNVGFTWNFDQANSVFFDYTQALNAPINDNLYAVATIGSGSTANSVGKNTVQPETTTTYELGYRYQTSKVKATVDIYKLDDNNHIVTSYNQLTGDSVDQNLGAINYYGAEGIVGFRPTTNWSMEGSFNYNHSKVGADIPYSASTIIPTNGKVAVDTPKWTLAGRTDYKWGDFTFGLQGKYVGARYVTLVNDLKVPSYVTWDGDIRYALNWVTHGSYLQFNIFNIFNAKYLTTLNTTSSNNSALQYYSQPYAKQAMPQTMELTLHAAF